MKELTPAEKIKAIIEVNKRLIGKMVFIISENAYGLVSEVIDEETFLINIRGSNRRVNIFDIRGTE